MDIAMIRPQSSQAAHALLQPRDCPREVEVDEHSSPSQAQSLAEYVRRNEKPERKSAARRLSIVCHVESANNLIDRHGPRCRSEERRVGKECRCRWWQDY